MRHGKVRRRLNSGNACYFSVQNILSSRPISKNLKIKILTVVLYGCETWTLTQREEHRLQTCKECSKSVALKADATFPPSPHFLNPKVSRLQSRTVLRIVKPGRLRWAGHVARIGGETRYACMILVGNPSGKRPLSIKRRRWVDNIMTDIREVGCEDGKWIKLVAGFE
ncbi:hypothetical protein L798_05029, partial [Zootermopsis nevadensis]